MNPPLYLLERITQTFDGRRVLSIDHLEIEEGNIYALLGPNGAGKTTLMKILGFLDRPSSGNLYFKGVKVRDEDAARLRSRVVWVPQSPVMFTGTVLYNVTYPLRIKGVAAVERRARAMELLAEVRLEHMANAPAMNLSGGEAQRVSAARALAAGAEVILFDEPTANLDYQARQEMQDLIQRLWSQKHLSLVITTHDVRLARELCRKIITLDDGSVSSKHFLPEDAAVPARVTFAKNRLTVFHRSETLSDSSDGHVAGIEKKDGTVTLAVLTLSGLIRFQLEDTACLQQITLDMPLSLHYTAE